MGDTNYRYFRIVLEIKCLKDELIGLQGDTHLQGMFQQELKTGTLSEFWCIILQ
jgi:hypothetical protein